MKKMIVIMMTLLMVFTSSLAFAETEAGAQEVMADTILLRPLGLAALAGGTVFFVTSLPIALITRSVDTTSKVLVRDPFVYTFKRPVGEFEKEY